MYIMMVFKTSTYVHTYIQERERDRRMKWSLRVLATGVRQPVVSVNGVCVALPPFAGISNGECDLAEQQEATYVCGV